MTADAALMADDIANLSVFGQLYSALPEPDPEEHVLAMPATYPASFLSLINERRDRGWKPRVHGNGFIQLDLALPEQAPNRGDIRLHIWGDRRIPRQKTPSTIHDHIFDFTSTIITGKLINVTYAIMGAVRDSANYKVYEPFVRSPVDTGLRDTGRFVYANPKNFSMICAEPGYSTFYHMPARLCHETICERPAATLMRKTGASQLEAHKGGETIYPPKVLVPLDSEPNNEFRRDAYPDYMLWDIIYSVLEGRST